MAMSSIAPLRDRAPSNATRSQAWHSQKTTTITTTPLRIAKRDSPQDASEDRNAPALTPSRRRSVRNLQDGARVSNSPFLISQLSVKPGVVYGTPTRRVSGEKRSRTQSMHDQAENENPAIRKRRQSQVSDLLNQKRPVTNSTFKAGRTTPSLEKPRRVSQDPKSPTPIPLQSHERENTPQPDAMYGEDELPPPHRGQSPARPSLVSRRLHGPRVTRRLSRRKTVTFDENCDVLEFDVEDDNSNPFDWVTDDDENLDHDRMNVDDEHHHEYNHVDNGDNDAHDNGQLGGPSMGQLRVQNPGPPEHSFESFQLGEDSITGLVNSMLNDARPKTPPHEEGALPDDLETEAGVPYGRTHHAERLAAAHQRVEHDDEPATVASFSLPSAVSSTPTRSRESTPIRSVSPGSRIPLGRSTHAERFKAQKEQERLGVDDDFHVPPSPSPVKKQTTLSANRENADSLIPRFALDVSKGLSSACTSVCHPFTRATILLWWQFSSVFRYSRYLF